MKDEGGKKGCEQGWEVEGKDGGSFAVMAHNLLTLTSRLPPGS